MKKIIALISLAVIMLLAMVSCSDDSKLIGLVPEYVGEAVTDTNHTFTKSDFLVHAVYENMEDDKDVTNYNYEVSLENGYYTITFTYGGFTEECFVPCDVAVYASDIQE